MVLLNDQELGLDDVEKVLFHNEKLELSPSIRQRVEESYSFLHEFSKNKIIYGINTGFGPMAQYRIGEDDQVQLQYNLIRSHASGLGNHLPPLEAKAAMIARLNTLSLGYSGVHISAIDVLLAMINNDVTPLIFEHGGVGASGDLVQLAHLALVMIGEGKVIYQGEIRPTAEVFEKLEIKPLQVTLREGLGIMNGTSVMSGIGLVNSAKAKDLIGWSVAATIMISELIDSYDDYYSVQLNHAKKHQGQRKVAAAIYEQMQESKYTRKREQELYEQLVKDEVIENKVQEYYSLRCVPQITGAILEAVETCQDRLIEEINSANDNPIVDVKTKNVYHGGNFHGDYVSFEMDKLKIAITKLSMVAERQTNFLMNPSLNSVLPPFVNLGKLGFNFGMQGIQFTATSTTAENQTLSNPMYVHSIPNNNDNQDIVSMGTNAAVIARKVIDNTYDVMAIELLTIVQALDLMKKTDGLSGVSKKVYDMVREIIPLFVNDYPVYEDLAKLKAAMVGKSPLAIK
ncbi:MAG: histidine ammonia-lyase [Crocinitomicaceae bacterium]|nr:histidine ammonia-lyase [Crocinitomicaceae bacterium]|tara:strand:- start:1087 stop:2628 length:1542 start_codon:yes stop_codon:yes gene_type:complete